MGKNWINWGILSCARIAEEQMASAIQKSSNGRLYAFAGRTPERLELFQEKFHAHRTYASYEQLLEDSEIDAVYIPLPNGLHKEWTIKALACGKHVLCEKPLACNQNDAEKMREAAESSGKVLMEGFAFRHNPQHQRVKRLVAEGKIGDLQLVEANYCFRLEDLTDIRYNAALGGGCMLDEGSYNINFIHYIVGEPPLHIDAYGTVDPVTGVDLNAVCLLTFPNHVKAVCHSAMDGEKREEYRLIGTKGILEVKNDYNAQGELFVNISQKNGRYGEKFSMDCPNNYLLQVEQFGRCVLNGEPPVLSLEESCMNAGIIDEIIRRIQKNHKQF